MKYLDGFSDYFDKVNEEVSKQTLYHYTTLSNLYLILKSDRMIARYVGDSSSGEWSKVADKSISFCRQYLTRDQLAGIQDGVEEPIRIIIHFDSDKLKEKYKIVPWSDARSKSDTVNNSQFEERCTSDIVNVKKYITRIQVIFDEVILGVRYNEVTMKNDGIKLSSGKKTTQSLPWGDFVNSEFFEKSLYSLVSLDKDLKRNFSKIFSSIKKFTGSSRAGNAILGSQLLICLWNWWFFHKIKELASGITFDIQDKTTKHNKLPGIKLSSSQQDLLDSLANYKVKLLKDLGEKYDEQTKQISRAEEVEKGNQKNTEKENRSKEEKTKQEVIDKENQKKWKEQGDIKRERERELEDKKYRETKRRVETKLNSELTKEPTYSSIVNWVETNMKGSKVYDKSNINDFFTYLGYSAYEIKDSKVSSVVGENSKEISKLIDNCKPQDVNETISKCKELMSEIKTLLGGVKTSTFSKIKKFFSK